MKFFSLPTPRELGHPENDLPSREWSPEESGYTWEDYDAEVEKKFPTRWKIHRVVSWFRRTWHRIDMWWFGILSKFWYKQHLLDLRKCGDQDYRGGYIDACDALPVAMFGILRHYVEECGTVQKVEELEAHLRDADSESLDDVERRMLSQSLDSGKEIVTLYRWWTEGRKEEERQLDILVKALSEKPISNNERSRRLDAYGKKEQEIEDNRAQMMLRLVRVHGSLWE